MVLPPVRLLLAGEAIADLVMRVPVLPARGGDLLASDSAVHAGGGFNVMAAAARQGMPVAYAGGHGTGPWGDLVRAALAAEGISLLRAPDPDADTGFDVAFVEPDGERTFVTSTGAETHPGGWTAIEVSPRDAVYISGYGLVPAPLPAPFPAPDPAREPEGGAVTDSPVGGPAGGGPAGVGPAVAGFVGGDPAGSGPEVGGPAGELGGWAAALPDGVVLFADPGPLVAGIPAATLDAVLARCDWWSCNRREAALLTGSADPVTAARALLRRTRGGVLVRCGPDGCVVGTAGDRDPRRVPAPVVDVVDTTGAGDAHAGVFLAGLAEGLDPLAAARRANAAAALAVTRYGPATAPSRRELDTFPW